MHGIRGEGMVRDVHQQGGDRERDAGENCQELPGPERAGIGL